VDVFLKWLHDDDDDDDSLKKDNLFPFFCSFVKTSLFPKAEKTIIKFFFSHFSPSSSSSSLRCTLGLEACGCFIITMMDPADCSTYYWDDDNDDHIFDKLRLVEQLVVLFPRPRHAHSS